MEQQNQNMFDLQVDQQTFHYFSESAKWAKFLAIVGFVGCAFLAIGALFAGASIGAMIPMMGGEAGTAGAVGGGIVTFVYLVFALIYFFPCLYLYRYASQMQLAIHHNEQTKMHTSIRNLKSFFKFFGILTIIWLALAILGMLGMMMAGVGELAS